MARNEPKLPEITQNGKKSPKMHKSEIFNFHQFSPNFHPFSPIFTHFHPFSPIFTHFPPIFTNFRPSISSLVYHEIKTHEICRRNDIFKKSHFFQAPIFSNFLQFFGRRRLKKRSEKTEIARSKRRHRKGGGQAAAKKRSPLRRMWNRGRARSAKVHACGAQLK